MTAAIQFVQTEGNLVSNMNDEKVMMSISTGKYYNLGRVGGRIWEIMEQPTTIQNIVVKLIEEFEVEREACESQVTTFVLHLLNEGLLKSEKIAG